MRFKMGNKNNKIIGNNSLFNSNIKKFLSFYHALKGMICLKLLDTQDANSMLKHGVFSTHLGIKKIINNIIWNNESLFDDVRLNKMNLLNNIDFRLINYYGVGR